MELSEQEATQLISTLVWSTDLPERMVLGTRLQLFVATRSKRSATVKRMEKEHDEDVNRMERAAEALERINDEVERLKQQLAARVLKWTTDKPTVPGWYWWRWEKASGEAAMVKVFERDGQLYGAWTQDLIEPVNADGGQWAGPIAGGEE